MARLLTLDELDVKNKKVLMRVDFNVPLDEQGSITDDTRIKRALPSIQYLLDHHASVVLMSHLGRPKGKVNAKYSLKPVQKRLEELLGKEVKMASDCVGDSVKKQANDLQAGEVLLLENLRFHPEEEKPTENDLFTQQLASLGDLYVNDAFGAAHRYHASTAAIAHFFRGKSAAGFLLLKEVEYLLTSLENPKRPFTAILGGAKVSTKLKVINRLFDKVDLLLIGGGMAYTFLKAAGLSIGSSLCEDDMLVEAKQILDRSQQQKGKLILPLDFRIANALSEVAETKIVTASSGIPAGYEGVDIGPATIELFSEKIRQSNTVLWNGPLGVFEIEPFAKGTRSIALCLANSNCTSIVGGGDSAAALEQMKLADKIDHVSTGGGAALELVQEGTLPALEALKDAADPS